MYCIHWIQNIHKHICKIYTKRSDDQNGNKQYHVYWSCPIRRNWWKLWNISVHFSDHYIAAFKYDSKSDNQELSSKNHLHVADIGSPKTKKPLFVYRNKRKHDEMSTSMQSDGTSNNVNKSKTPRQLYDLDVSELRIIIRNTTELFTTSYKRKNDG